MALRSTPLIGWAPLIGWSPLIGWAPLCVVVALLAATAGCGPSQPPPVDPPRGDVEPPGGRPPPVAGPTSAADSSAQPGTTASGTASPPPKLNVVVIFVDAMRADMPWAGYPRDIAPNLTALEKQSVSYTRAYALSSYTAMSDAGFLAGRYPGELKRSGYFFSAYPDDELFFPELLQPAGVRTLAAHAHFYFEKKAGFHQGFDDYRMVPDLDANNTTDKNVTSPQHVALAQTMLSEKANTGGQFFAWFHFMDPHDRYGTHEGFTKW
ncbi:MAG: sulfatase-like hydrolase/transferase, partial [Deltaproteobacteria bacterium]|nr:sulfatase-like hydrolase/transferase [Deltaproteobacteria bacterium]